MPTPAGRLATALLVLPLLLTACTDSTPVNAPAPSTSGTPTKTPLQINSSHTGTELRAALPTKYGKLAFRLDSGSTGATSWDPRDDPFAGHQVEPESCRDSLWRGSLTETTYAEFPYRPRATAILTDQINHLGVELISIPEPYGDRYLDLYPLAAPQCAKVRIDGAESASITEQSVSDLGTRSRYVLRLYSIAGRPHREAIITFITPTYFARVYSYLPTFSETDLIAFARQVQALADKKLAG